MLFNILLTLSTLTALSSNAAAQLPLGGLNGLNSLNGLGGLGNQGVPSSQIPSPSSTRIPTLMKMQATPTAFPSQTPSLSTPVPSASASSVGLQNSLPLGSVLGGAL
ncbi:hypothetical protein N7471_009663 [Penicillium samsonianum]|uniref:uncharacterized protein n=1 Tax=Penicillium samsonianum TaxID=1882272 RepID=UPI0025485E5F|nr:uncharacterized protein N7471_009663 [Penicillium samsonianum]KAJ6128446.1 hypothetical protein N7471_009663 [Penicillium samsonianum]